DLDVERDAEAVEDGNDVARADDAGGDAAARAAAASTDERRLAVAAERCVREIAAEGRLEAIARHAEEGARIGAEEIAGVGDEDQLVEVEGLALFGDERREGEAALVELARFDGDKGAIDELARLAGAEDDFVIALGLARDLVAHAGAGGAHFIVEAFGL